MIIIRAQGGLGNQMFQYALYRKLKELGKDVYLDINYYDEYEQHNGFELDRIFDLKILYSKKQDAEFFLDDNMNFISRIRRKIFGRKVTHIIESEKGYRFHGEIFNLTEGYLNGYWQTEKYFSDIRTIILEDYKFNVNDSENLNLLKDMEKHETVSVHVRRGDYISNPKAAIMHGGITTKKYYDNAINLIKSKVKNPKFIIFSDDVKWVKENLNIENSVIVDWNKNEQSYKDMYLMSRCKHNIIANSSFSWWGAWLNINEDKIVIAPNKWFNTIDTPDILCSLWIEGSTK